MFSALQPIMRLSLCAALALGLASGRASDSSTPGADDNLAPSAGRVAGAQHGRQVERRGSTLPKIGLSLDALDVLPAARTRAAETAVAPLVRPSAEEYSDHPESRKVYRICRVTAYCDRGTTASGVPSGVGQCAAPGDIPFGSLVYIPALDETYVVTDRTHRRFRNSTIDVFIPSKRDCRQFGRSFLECEIHVDPLQVRKQRLSVFRGGR